MPEAIGTLILESVLAEATAWGTTAVVSSTAATIVGNVVLAGALGGAALLFRPGPQSPQIPTDGTQTLKQGTPPRIFGYGRARIAGAYMFYDAVIANQGSSYDVIALHHGLVAGFAWWYLSDDLAFVANGGGIAVAVAYGDGRYANNSVSIKRRYGVIPETNFSETAATFPTKWTSAHRGDGIASAQIFCNGVSQATFFNNYPHGLPKLSAVCDLTAIYDPRDATQSQTDATTWKVSRNPVLQILDYLTSSDHGLGQSWADIVAPNITALMVQASICDQVVTRNDGGAEYRYQSSGFAYLSTDPAEVLSAILATCDGWMAEGPDGTLALVVGQYLAPTVTLTDDHILAVTIDHGVSDEEDVNELRVSYMPPGNDYRSTEGDPWQDAASISASGRTRPQNLSLAWVHSHTQARRLAKRAMARHQAKLRGTMVTTLYGLKCLGQRWVAVQSGIMTDLASAVIEITKAKIDLASARLSFDWVLTDPTTIDAWNAATEDGTEPFNAFSYNLIPVASAPADSITLTDAGGQVIKLALAMVQGSLALNPALRYRVGYKLGTAAEQFLEVTEPTLDNNTLTILIATGAAGTYAVRLAYRNLDGTLSSYTVAANIAIA